MKGVRDSLLWGLLLVTLPWQHAAAHAVLVKSMPVRDALLAASPTTITLWFNEPLEGAFSTVRVHDGTGQVVAEGPLATPENKALSLALPAALPPGRYTVRFRVLSVDGHIVEDRLDFEIGPAAP